MTFEKFYYLNEARFRDSQKVKHVFDVPMFSLFAHKDLMFSDRFNHELDVIRDLNNKRVKNIFTKARTEIQKLGFPSMHSNVVFKDLTNEVNKNTGGGVGGFAHRKGKYMSVDYDTFFDNPKFAVNVIVHEWAHLWMFNNSANFTKAVKQHYQHIVKSHYGNIELEKNDKNYKTEEIFAIMKEFWIPAIEKLFTPSISDETWANNYILKNSKLRTWNDMQYLPYGWRFTGTTTNRMKGMPVGTPVTIEKNHDEWVIGPKRFPVSLGSISMYIETEQPLFNIINAHHWLTNVSNDDLVENVRAGIYGRLRSTFEWICRKHMPNTSEKEYKSFLEKGTDVLLPIVLNYLKNIMMKPKVEKAYYNYWVQAIPNDMSFTETIRQLLWNHSKSNTPSRLSGKEFNDIREQMKELAQWSNEYGMSNEDELWATGIEEFSKLPKDHKQAILDLMRVTGSRYTPNRRHKKHNKQSIAKITLDDL